MAGPLPDGLAERDRWLRARLDALGITRLAATDGLDRLGIPTHAVVQPGTTDTIWVYSGKGLSPEQSRVSAIMESVERTAALWSAHVEDTEQGARVRVGRAWGARRFTERTADPLPERYAWAVAREVPGGRPVAVPADLVFTGHRPRGAPLSPVAVRTSNGLAAGFTREEALRAALLEVMERDVVSTFELACGHYAAGVLSRLCRAAGIDPGAVLFSFRDDTLRPATIDPLRAPPQVADLAQRFIDAGLRCVVKLLPNDFGVPVAAAAVVEELGWDTLAATAGYGIAGDAVTAATRALLELAQSRATDRQGAREDCGVGEKGRLDRAPADHWLLEPGPVQPWGQVAPAATSTDVATLLDRLRQAGLGEVAAVDFDAPCGLKAVRVLVPEAETWHPTGGNARLGRRTSALLGTGGSDLPAEVEA